MAAERAFSEAVNAADGLLEQTAGVYDALNTRALALCGLISVDDSRSPSGASAGFRAAREITRANGVVGRVLRLFDALAAGDKTGVLDPLRRAAAGDA
jgi:hypothetical protein